jgi:hypothetical protein
MKLPAGVMGALGTLGKQWIKVDVTKLAGIPGLSSLQGSPASTDPSQMLEYLRAVSDSIVAEGSQRVDGFETTHYRANLSLDRVAGTLPSGDQAAQQGLSTLEKIVHVIPVDVWVDARHLVRRMQVTIGASLPTGQTMEVGATTDFSHYGPQRRPTPPPADEVQDISGLMPHGS